MWETKYLVKTYKLLEYKNRQIYLDFSNIESIELVDKKYDKVRKSQKITELFELTIVMLSGNYYEFIFDTKKERSDFFKEIKDGLGVKE